jgi:hypothetical protein
VRKSSIRHLLHAPAVPLWEAIGVEGVSSPEGENDVPVRQ